MRRALVVSVVVHGALCFAAASGRVLVPNDPVASRSSIAFELIVEEVVRPPSEDGDDGKLRAGVEDARPTGQPDRRTVGLAGDRTAERASGVHAVGESDRERVTALAEAIGALARVESPIPPSGTRDEATDGTTTTGSLVSPGTRGLDMVGTGRGSGPHGEDEGLGDRVVGLGSLGAAMRDHEYAIPRGRVDRAICVTRRCQPDPRPRWAVRAYVLAGPLDPRGIERLVRRRTPEILACEEDLARFELVVAMDGRVIASSSTPRVPCIENVLRSIVFPPAPAPSRVTLRTFIAMG